MPKVKVVPFFEGQQVVDSSQTNQKHKKADAVHARQLSRLPNPTEVEFTISRSKDGITLSAQDLEFDLSVDRSYQRRLNRQRAERYADNFDLALFGRPYLSLRDDGALYVVSGQHRMAAAAFAGVEAIKALVYEGLSVEDEAFLFHRESVDQVKITAQDRFHSGVMAGYPEYVDINRMVTELGGKINRIPNGSTGINCTDALLKAYVFGGPELFKRSLTFISNAWGLDGAAVESPMVTGMVLFLGIHGEQIKDSRWRDRLSTITAESLRGQAKVYEANKTQQQARYLALIDLYNYKAHNQIDPVKADYRRIAPKVCSLEGCDSKHYGRGFCKTHWNEWRGGNKSKGAAKTKVFA